MAFNELISDSHGTCVSVCYDMKKKTEITKNADTNSRFRAVNNVLQ